MLLQFNDAGTMRNDNRYAVIVHLFLYNFHVLFVVFRQRNDVADVFRLYAKTFTDTTDLVVCRRRLAASHGSDVVVEDHDHDVGFFIDAVHETCQSAMAESAVTDDCH